MAKPVSKILFSILILSLCAHLTFSQKETKVTAAEYKIYASILRRIYKDNRRDYSNESHFVFVDKTLTSTDFNEPTEKKFRPLVRMFKELIQLPGLIERKFPRGGYSKTYYLISQGELDELFRVGQIEYEKREAEESREQRVREADLCGSIHWQPFYRRYPEASGYYKLSRVALRSNLAMARVQREDVCGGFDMTYILKKTKKRWIEIWSAGSHWVS